NSLGIEIDKSLLPTIQIGMEQVPQMSREIALQRMRSHMAFVERRQVDEKPLKHRNEHLQLPVITSQERELKFLIAETCTAKANEVLCNLIPANFDLMLKEDRKSVV